MKSVTEIYHEAISATDNSKIEDPAIEQAALEKRIWLASSKTKELSQQLQAVLAAQLEQSQALACQASKDTDDKIRSLLQQSTIIRKVINVLEGKTDKYE